MKSTNKLICLMLFSCFIGACTKNAENPECPDNGNEIFKDDCVPIPNPPEFFQQWPMVTPDVVINLTADVNPENNDQFCILQQLGPGNEQIIIYTRSTNQVEILLQGDFSPKINWMVDEWIIFKEADNSTIQRIKSDGSQIEDVFEGASSQIKRNFDHTKLLCQNNYITYIVEGTTVLDTIDYNFPSDGNWDHPAGKLLFPNLYDIGIHQFLEEEADNLLIESNERIDDVYWCDSFTRLIWLSREGWFKTNPTTLESKQIRENCDAKSYRFHAHIDDQILVTCFYKEPYIGDTLLSTGRVGLVKCDGSSIDFFDIPQ